MTVVEIIRALALLFCFAVFLLGFFPLKNTSRGYSTYKMNPHSFSSFSTSKLAQRNHENSHEYKYEESVKIPPYKRMIIMVIDALRTDFVFGPQVYMPEMKHLLRKGHGMSFTAESHPPTVTMPRIKAITTGTIPNFIDVFLNVGSPALTEDSIIAQMKIDKKKVIFFGDDTWIHLFPNHFERSDGTTSFFVMDYTEVDNNVTRHFEKELDKDADWDVMILHYLGLDHIGHFAGPNSPLVRPKLAEMDRIIAKLYSAIENWSNNGIPSLLVICGDHGMSDQGGHGGSTAAEISVPAVFLSPHMQSGGFTYTGPISQIDLCPTMSVLLGLPVPMNNLGKVIVDTLVDFSLEEKLSMLQQNFQQVIRVAKSQISDIHKESAYMLYEKAQADYQEWIKTKDSVASQEWQRTGQSILVAYLESLHLIAEKVGKMSIQHDVYALAACIVLFWLILLSLVLSHLEKRPRHSGLSFLSYMKPLALLIGSALMTHITMCTVGLPSNMMCSSSLFSLCIQVLMAGIFIACMLHILIEWGRCLPLSQLLLSYKEKTNFVEVFLIVSTFVHSFTLLSSSFVEEEHQTLYFFTTSVHLILLIRLCLLVQKSLLFDRSTILRGNYRETENNVCKSSNKYTSAFPKGSECNVSRSSQDSLADEDSHIEFVTHQIPYGTYVSSMRREEELSRRVKASQRQSNSKAYIAQKDALQLFASLAMILIILRICRMWNQTGNKWLNTPDIGDWLVEPQHKGYLSFAVVFSLLILGTSRGATIKRSISVPVNLSLAAVYLFRSAHATGSLYFPQRRFLSDKGRLEARCSYFFICLTAILSLLPPDFFNLARSNSTERESNQYGSISRAKRLPLDDQRKPHDVRKKEENDDVTLQTSAKNQSECNAADDKKLVAADKNTQKDFLFERRLQVINGIMTAWLCLMCLLLRPHNIPLVAMMSLIEQLSSHVIVRSELRTNIILIYCLWMGHAFFFFQGNSNSISTVDVSAGYIGLVEYNPVLIGFLIAIATYSGPIFWLLVFVKITVLTQRRNQDNGPSVSYESSFQALMLKLNLPIAIYSALVAAQRYHLFVWTVFSPKLIYLSVETGVLITVSLLILFLGSWV